MSNEKELEVLIVEKEGTLPEKLGVSPERAAEIKEALTGAVFVADDVIGAMAEASKMCKDPNELALVCFMIGGWHEYQKNPLEKLFESFKP